MFGLQLRNIDSIQIAFFSIVFTAIGYFLYFLGKTIAIYKGKEDTNYESIFESIFFSMFLGFSFVISLAVSIYLPILLFSIPPILILIAQLVLIFLIGKEIDKNKNLLYKKIKNKTTLDQYKMIILIILIQAFSFLAPIPFLTTVDSNKANLPYLFLSGIFSLASIVFSAILYAIRYREYLDIEIKLTDGRKIKGIQKGISEDFVYLQKNKELFAINKSLINYIRVRKIK